MPTTELKRDMEAVSRTELTQRRQQLRQQRRIRWLKTSWRIVAMVGLTAGSIHLARLPDWWVLKQAEQIEVAGNQLIPTATVRSLLKITYPQSVLQIEPEVLARQLQQEAPLSEAVVNRHLFPPGLSVQLKERLPVAIVVPGGADHPVSTTESSQGAASPGKATSMGLIDQTGVWTPLETYTRLNPTLKLPNLKLIGYQTRDQQNWPAMLQAIRQSPVTISEVDLRDPTNLILKTDIGTAHVGPYSDQFARQLVILDQMRKLPTHVKPGEVAYFNLRNPDSPAIALSQTQENP